MTKLRKVSLFVMLLGVLVTLYSLPVRAFAKNSGGSYPPNGHSYSYYRHHTYKMVWEAPANPKKFALFAVQLTHNLTSLLGHGIRVKQIVVAAGPQIAFLMKKTDAANYGKLKRLSELGVRFVACHAAIVGGHLDRKDFFPFVGAAYPSGIVYLAKKEAQGYSLFTIGN